MECYKMFWPKPRSDPTINRRLIRESCLPTGITKSYCWAFRKINLQRKSLTVFFPPHPTPKLFLLGGGGGAGEMDTGKWKPRNGLVAECYMP